MTIDAKIDETLDGIRNAIPDGPERDHGTFQGDPGETARARFVQGQFPKRHAQWKIADAEKNTGWAKVFNNVQKRLQDEHGALIGILGNRRTGKTLLATCLAKVRANAGDSVRYLHALEYFLELDDAISDPTRSALAVINSYYRPQFLVIDELQERGDMRWESRLTLLIDKRYRDGKSTILIANLNPEQFAENVGASVARRIDDAGGQIVCDWEIS